MFSIAMSRALACLVFGILVLALNGCISVPPEEASPADNTTAHQDTAVHHWLQLQREIQGLSPEQVAARLLAMENPEPGDQRFQFGLLNHQLQTFGAWTRARDAFAQLQEDEKLLEEQRQLARMLREFNQSRINWYQRHGDLRNQHAQLQQRLDNSEQEKALLEQKIQALTDLETVISTRKEE